MGLARASGSPRWSCCVPVALLVPFLGLAVASPALASAKPKVSAAFGLTATKITVTGAVSKHAPSDAAWKAALQQKLGKRWVKRASARLRAEKGRSSTYHLTWKPPKSVSAGTFRVAILSGERTVATSKPKRLAFGRGDPVPAPKVGKVKPSQVLKAPSKGSPKLVLSGAHQFTPGQFLAAAPGSGAPEGFLLKVISSNVSHGKTTVKVKAASLYEAVPNGQISASLADLGAATPQNRDARIFTRAVRSASASASNSADIPFKEKVSCSASAEMTLSGSLHASLAPNFILKWHTFLGAPTSIDRARATVDASLSAEAEARVSGTAGCKLDPITLLDPHWTVLVEVGPVPVPVTIDTPIRLEASASVSGKVHVKASAGVQGSLGLEYHHGDISGVHEISSDASLEHEVDASASAEAKIGPDITVEAGWHVPVLGELAAKVDADITSGLQLTYDPPTEPPGKLCVPLSVEGSIGLEIPVKGEISAGPKELLDTDIKCVTFGAEAQWSGTIEVEWSNSANSNQHGGITSYVLGPATHLGRTPSAYTASEIGNDYVGEPPHVLNHYEGQGSGVGVIEALPLEDGYHMFLLNSPPPSNYQGTYETFNNNGELMDSGTSTFAPAPFNQCMPPLPLSMSHWTGTETALCHQPNEDMKVTWDLTRTPR
jgi:hypothetical protein